jgi:hypothetical protein
VQAELRSPPQHVVGSRRPLLSDEIFDLSFEEVAAEFHAQIAEGSRILSVPITSSGKLARRRTRDLFLKGEPSAIAPWYSVESANARRGDDTWSEIRSV